MFHCAFGQGNNSLTDGFAVADKMRREFPEYYELLCKYGMNAGRELMYYKAGDITFTGLNIRSKINPLLHTSDFVPFSAASTPILTTNYYLDSLVFEIL